MQFCSGLLMHFYSGVDSAARWEPRRWRGGGLMSTGIIGDLLLGLLAGLVLGALHLLWLRRAAARLGAGAGGTGALLAGAALRLAIVLAGFAAVAWVATQPGLSLIAALGGFVSARTLGLWRVRHIKR
jgi:hypothetical protein